MSYSTILNTLVCSGMFLDVLFKGDRHENFGCHSPCATHHTPVVHYYILAFKFQALPSSSRSQPTTTTTPPPSQTMSVSPSTPSRRPRAPSQWLFTKSETRATPSIKDGVDPKQERANRLKGIQFIDKVGRILKLHQTTIATAAMFFHRFFMRQSMQRFHFYVLPSHPVPDTVSPASVCSSQSPPSTVSAQGHRVYLSTHETYNPGCSRNKYLPRHKSGRKPAQTARSNYRRGTVHTARPGAGNRRTVQGVLEMARHDSIRRRTPPGGAVL